MTSQPPAPPTRGAALAGIFGGSHLPAWFLVVLATALLGTAGYVALFRWPLNDALYMTVITLTTVGFKEVQDLDDAERAWTGLLAIAGVGIIFGTVGFVAEAIVGGLISGRREERRMTESIARLSEHFLLCGYGRVGSTVARELVRQGTRVVVVDLAPEPVARARRDGLLALEGDATDDRTLIGAGIHRARGLITTLDSDANNVYVVLSARALEPDLFILGRATADGAEAKLIQAGANRVVSPYTMAGRRIAELAIRPRVTEFIDLALSGGELAFTLEELVVPDGSPLVGTSVGGLRQRGLFTLAIVPEEGPYQPNPPDDRILEAREGLVLSGSADALTQFRRETGA